MDKHQQVFWTDINLRHKNKCPTKKKKTINTNGIICSRQNSKNRFKSSHSTWRTNQQNGKRIWNWYFIYQFHPGPFMSLNWYPVIKHNNDKETENGDSYAINTDDDKQTKNGVTPFAPSLFSFYMMNTKFLHDTRETSLLTALFFSQFVLSSCLRTAHSERLCC
jgi:hypothetical protein